MLTYTQIEAIHEAMREMDHAIGDGYSDDVALCLFVARRLAKIRAALAGEMLRERAPVENWGDPTKCLVCSATHDGAMCPSMAPLSLRDGGV